MLFLAKWSETYEAKLSETKLFLWFRETEAKRSETVYVSLSFASKRNFFKSEIGTPYLCPVSLSFLASRLSWISSTAWLHLSCPEPLSSDIPLVLLSLQSWIPLVPNTPFLVSLQSWIPFFLLWKSKNILTKKVIATDELRREGIF